MLFILLYLTNKFYRPHVLCISWVSKCFIALAMLNYTMYRKILFPSIQ